MPERYTPVLVPDPDKPYIHFRADAAGDWVRHADLPQPHPVLRELVAEVRRLQLQWALDPELIARAERAAGVSA